MSNVPPSEHVRAAVARVHETDATALQRADALSEIALDLQKQPRDPQALHDALYLYGEALELAKEEPVAVARLQAGRGSARRRMPGSGLDDLLSARDDFSAALPVLTEAGSDEEVAELQLSYGLVVHALAQSGRANLQDAVTAYHAALRTFTASTYPREFATLHNNLATAYLSMRLAPDKEGLREAMAVQSFEHALEVVTLEEDPSEYAMLHNNLGNALQAMPSSHRLQNLARAVEAYDEALKVRTARDTPVEYANTIANKANALMNLPDDFEDFDKGNPENLRAAVALLREASSVFAEHHLADRAQIVDGIVDDLEAELNGQAGT